MAKVTTPINKVNNINAKELSYEERLGIKSDFFTLLKKAADPVRKQKSKQRK
jgi:hypothetical protein